MGSDRSLLVDSWRMALAADGYSATTQRTYANAVKSLQTWAAEHHPELGPAQLDREHVRAWLADLRPPARPARRTAGSRGSATSAGSWSTRGRPTTTRPTASGRLGRPGQRRRAGRRGRPPLLPGRPALGPPSHLAGRLADRTSRRWIARLTGVQRPAEGSRRRRRLLTTPRPGRLQLSRPPWKVITANRPGIARALAPSGPGSGELPVE